MFGGCHEENYNYGCGAGVDFVDIGVRYTSLLRRGCQLWLCHYRTVLLGILQSASNVCSPSLWARCCLRPLLWYWVSNKFSGWPDPDQQSVWRTSSRSSLGKLSGGENTSCFDVFFLLPQLQILMSPLVAPTVSVMKSGWFKKCNFYDIRLEAMCCLQRTWSFSMRRKYVYMSTRVIWRTGHKSSRR